MNVSITFVPSGLSGLVAEGTYLVDAARRLGAPLGAGCTAGKGDCPTCFVVITSGAELLSIPSDLETRLLGADQLAQSVRLACQVKILHGGELVVKSSQPTRNAPQQASESDLRKQFGELTLNQKIATLLRLEAITISEAFDAALQKPMTLGSRALESLADRVRSARIQRQEKNQKSSDHQS